MQSEIAEWIINQRKREQYLESCSETWGEGAQRGLHDSKAVSKSQTRRLTSDVLPVLTSSCSSFTPKPLENCFPLGQDSLSSNVRLLIWYWQLSYDTSCAANTSLGTSLGALKTTENSCIISQLNRHCFGSFSAIEKSTVIAVTCNRTIFHYVRSGQTTEQKNEIQSQFVFQPFSRRETP